jgi:hypothetical protein
MRDVAVSTYVCFSDLPSSEIGQLTRGILVNQDIDSLNDFHS